ncbi:GTPase [Lapillicoccus jejuensis]|uniref:50S ribosome-binding GTPase n=1 Tax=Lapillicoccus jejuensis TaxID=402171 RepID=A0A542DVM0_9MICO|nr:GTPase [Lapillicoccus jejuensis]TQJ07128.1 50S ribosome-binding GTPase [Lapillicoccus jejuensis]
MSPLLMGSRTAPAPDPGVLLARAGDLAAAVVDGGAQLPPEDAGAAQEVVEKVRDRVRLGDGHVVAVLAGATGSGKSSLFNALVGHDVSPVGVRRPTTSTPAAAVWGDAPAAELLDWLGIERRHGVDPTDRLGGVVGSLDGLLLVDLPDLDSRETAHRLETDRLLERCDVFVWVTDPQKYADAVLHDDYVRRLADHEASMLVVLNQADRLGGTDDVRACRDDLRRLLTDDAVEPTAVLTTSAVTGAGVDELRQRLANTVAGRAVVHHRLATDLGGAARALRRGVGDTEPALEGEASYGGLVTALGRAAGVPVVLDAVEADHRRASLARTGWLFTRWRRHLSADPLTRLRLGVGAIPGVAGLRGEDVRGDVRALLGRSSLPAPSAGARSAVRLATTDLTDRASQGLPLRWAQAVQDTASPDRTRLEERLDRAVTGTSLRVPDPLSWRVLGALQWGLGAAAVLGLLWALAVFVVAWFRLPTLPGVDLGPLPLWLVLLVVGVVGGLGLAALGRVLAGRGAVRRRRLVARRLDEAVGEVAVEQVVDPVRAVLARHARVRTRLDSALPDPR